MISKFKQTVSRHLSNLPGWRTNRKIVVIESDDWGSIRMPSKKAYERLSAKGLNLGRGEGIRYNLYDTLATSEDLLSLYEILSSFRDKSGHHPVITAVSLVANPDFHKIKACNFEEYHYEPFTKTLEKYERLDTWPLWQEGKQKELYWPEFHGREHLNIAAWMRALQNGDKHTLSAFEEGCWGFTKMHPFGLKYQAAFDLEKKEDLVIQEKVISEGLQLFEKLHGYKACFFVPPNGNFNNSLEAAAVSGGIIYMSASKIQKEAMGQGKTRKVLHCLGQSNAHGQRYLTRNAFFEPSAAGSNWVDSCLNDIQIAFSWRKPAVISTHRVNFIGGIDPKNRDEGLRQLSQLLSKILIYWPDVEFVTSTKLGDIISNDK